MIFKIPMKVKKLRDNAILPVYAHDTDTGCDLFISRIKVKSRKDSTFVYANKSSYSIAPFETVMCCLGFSVEFEKGFDIQIRPTSGNSLHTPLRIANSPGTIDAGYRGELAVIIQNVSLEPFTICEGEKIGQMVITNIIQAKFNEVEELTETERGLNGFGSTGYINNNK